MSKEGNSGERPIRDGRFIAVYLEEGHGPPSFCRKEKDFTVEDYREVWEVLEGIGRIHDYLRRSNLQKMANRKIATGESVDLNRTQGTSSFGAPTTGSAARAKKKTSADQRRLAAIRQKMKNGDKLSGEDMKYLKENDTALYRKARTIESAREELARDLRKARTKGEARLAMVRAAMKVSSEAAMADAGLDGAAGAGAGNTAASGGAEGAAVPSAGVNAKAPIGAEAAPTGTGGAAATPADSFTGNGGAAEGMCAAAAKGTAEAAEKEVQAAIAAAMKAATEVADAMAQTEAENKDAKSTLNRLMDGEAVDEADAAMPPTGLLIIRALQKTWMAYINSEAYRDLPNDEKDEAREKASGGHVSKAVRRERHLAAAFSYHQAAQRALQMAEKPNA